MKKKSSNSLKKILTGFLLINFFMIASALTASFDEKEYLDYLGYPDPLANVILRQNHSARLFFLDHAFNSYLEELYYGVLVDGILKEEEIKLIGHVKKTYPNQRIKFHEVIAFDNLLQVNDWELFFSFNIPLDLISLIDFDEKMMEQVEEVVYPAEVPFIPVITYHMVDDSRYWINQISFQWQLEQLANAGFSTIRADAFFRGDFSGIPEGRKPVLLTFDDGWESQFRLLDAHTPDPISGVGMIQSIAEKYPEFGNHAVFYIYFSIIPFGETQHPGRWREKLIYLQEHGFEIGNHTYDHQIMTRFSPEQIKDNLDKFYQRLEKIPEIDISKAMTLAYPGGYIPLHRESIENYEYKGQPLLGAFKAWGEKALIPLHPDADIYNLPRYEGNNENIRKILQDDFFIKRSLYMTLPELFTQSKQLMIFYLSEFTGTLEFDLIWRGKWMESNRLMEDL